MFLVYVNTNISCIINFCCYQRWQCHHTCSSMEVHEWWFGGLKCIWRAAKTYAKLYIILKLLFSWVRICYSFCYTISPNKISWICEDNWELSSHLSITNFAAGVTIHHDEPSFTWQCWHLAQPQASACSHIQQKTIPRLPRTYLQNCSVEHK